ncbi:MAG TPA: hypothetical protein ENN88_02125 [Candidatus Coatesbacteria bacterium]|nr:hypothetical protein [Candidatus Coatesbacteria bacterium]
MTVDLTQVKLLLVRPGRFRPWCLVDPQRWGAAGAKGETAMLRITSCALDETQFLSLAFLLFGRTVTLTAYHADYDGSTFSTKLRFDEKVTMPIGCWRMPHGLRRLFERRPELRVRLRDTDRRRDFPLVLVPYFIVPEGEGLVLVEPVSIAIPALDRQERDLACQAVGLG